MRRLRLPSASRPDAVVSDVAPLSELVERFFASPRTRAELLALLAASTDPLTALRAE